MSGKKDAFSDLLMMANELVARDLKTLRELAETLDETAAKSTKSKVEEKKKSKAA